MLFAACHTGVAICRPRAFHDDVANAAVAECAGPAEGVGEMPSWGLSEAGPQYGWIGHDWPGSETLHPSSHSAFALSQPARYTIAESARAVRHDEGTLTESGRGRAILSRIIRLHLSYETRRHNGGHLCVERDLVTTRVPHGVGSVRQSGLENASRAASKPSGTQTRIRGTFCSKISRTRTLSQQPGRSRRRRNKAGGLSRHRRAFMRHGGTIRA
jgi:hypothetical protein